MKATETPTPRELYHDVCTAYELASRLTTTRMRAPETYAEMSWFIWKVLGNCAEFMSKYSQLESAQPNEG